MVRCQAVIELVSSLTKTDDDGSAAIVGGNDIVENLVYPKAQQTKSMQYMMLPVTSIVFSGLA
jgi:hypothetical protein